MPREFVGLESPDECVQGAGHAEQSVQNWLGTDCGVSNADVQLGGPLFRGAHDRTAFRMFWRAQ